MNAGNALEVHNLTKILNGRKVVDGVSFTLRRGEVLGLLGPNGAGKSTTMRMVAGLVRPTQGEVYILGQSLRRPACALRRIGAIIEYPEFYTYLSARENLEFLSKLSGGRGQTRVDEVLEMVGLKKYEKDKVATYSLGMRQRLGLAQALLSHPYIVLLDEPMNGLDPGGMKGIRELIRGLARRGTAFLISSHLLNEVSLVCDRVVIMNYGKAVTQGEIKNLLGNRNNSILIGVSRRREARFELTRNGWRCEEASHHRGLVGGNLQVYASPEQVPDLNAFLVSRGFRVYKLSPMILSLEEFFLHITTRGGELESNSTGKF